MTTQNQVPNNLLQPVLASLPDASIPLVGAGFTVNEQWHRFFQAMYVRSGGSVDKTAALANIPIGTGKGLTGGAALGEGPNLALDQDTGWNLPDNPSNVLPLKTEYTVYAGQTFGSSYDQTVAQNNDDAVAALTARVLALENAMRNNGSIDGNP